MFCNCVCVCVFVWVACTATAPVWRKWFFSKISQLQLDGWSGVHSAARRSVRWNPIDDVAKVPSGRATDSVSLFCYVFVCVCVPVFLCLCSCCLCDCLLLSLLFSLHSPEFVVSFSTYILELIANESDVCTRMCVCLCVWECVCTIYANKGALLLFHLSSLSVFNV